MPFGRAFVGNCSTRRPAGCQKLLVSNELVLMTPRSDDDFVQLGLSPPLYGDVVITVLQYCFNI